MCRSCCCLQKSNNNNNNERKEKMVVCSYTGQIEKQSDPQARVLDVPGSSNVVGAMDLALRRLNEDQLQKLAIC